MKGEIKDYDFLINGTRANEENQRLMRNKQYIEAKGGNNGLRGKEWHKS